MTLMSAVSDLVEFALVVCGTSVGESYIRQSLCNIDMLLSEIAAHIAYDVLYELVHICLLCKSHTAHSSLTLLLCLQTCAT